MKTRSPSALQTLVGCPRRHALREAGWVRRPDPTRAPPPHAQFGRLWHAGAEVFDRAMFKGEARERATDAAMEYASEATWEHDYSGESAGRPWAGEVFDEWRCVDGKVKNPDTGRMVKCPASKGWWVRNGGNDAYLMCTCAHCGGPIEFRTAYTPYHKTKNRITLLRAVLDYCDEALPGVAAIDGEPGLEKELWFRLGGLDLHCILDRYTQIGSTFLAHERKSSSRYPFWDTYTQTFQVRFYPEALRQNGLKCDGVLLEHYQIQAGGTHRSTVTLTPGPDQMTEAAEVAVREIDAIKQWEGHDPLSYPPRFSHCAHAAGGMPCEYLKVCTKGFMRRAEVLKSEFEQKERGQ